LVIADQVVLPGGLAGLGGVEHDRTKLFSTGLGYADGSPPASFDASARVSLLDEWGMDGCISLPTIGILPVPTDDLDLISAYCRAYNTWQNEFAGEAQGRVASIACVNWRDLDAAVAELERCLALGAKGLFVPPEPIDGRRPSDPHFDPIWQRLAEAGLPGCLHVIVRFSGAAMPFASWSQAGASPGPIFGFGLGAPGQLIPALASMVVDGLFDRIPKLNMVSIEAGCGWAGYLMDRLDEKHAVLGGLSPKPLALKPSEYISRNCYFVAEPEERTIGAMLDLVGERNILWGSDYPHIDSSLAAPTNIRTAVADLSAARQAAVLGENAARVFKFQPPPHAKEA
jgi:predicted TIM-barrel fold metal-dependent hydrolase